jgi:hypothetical protein
MLQLLWLSWWEDQSILFMTNLIDWICLFFYFETVRNLSISSLYTYFWREQMIDVDFLTLNSNIIFGSSTIHRGPIIRRLIHRRVNSSRVHRRFIAGRFFVGRFSPGSFHRKIFLSQVFDPDAAWKLVFLNCRQTGSAMNKNYIFNQVDFSKTGFPVATSGNETVFTTKRTQFCMSSQKISCFN